MVAEIHGTPVSTGNVASGTWEQAVQWLRQQSDQQELVRAAYYDDPLLAAARRYWSSEEWQAVRGYLPPGKGAALDVGAGRGIASFALAQDGFVVTALEPDPSPVVGAGAIRSLSLEGRMPIEVVQGVTEHLPFADDTFDVVFARAVLHHASDLRAACREFHRVLRPGGVLIAIREHVISRIEDLEKFLEQHPLHKLYGGERAYLLSQYMEALQQASFHRIECIAPLQSPINFAPHSSESVRREVALKAGVGPLYRLLHALLRNDSMWRSLQPLLARVDHRPGRHYSFVCRKPAP